MVGIDEVAKSFDCVAAHPSRMRTHESSDKSGSAIDRKQVGRPDNICLGKRRFCRDWERNTMWFHWLTSVANFRRYRQRDATCSRPKKKQGARIFPAISFIS